MAEDRQLGHTTYGNIEEAMVDLNTTVAVIEDDGRVGYVVILHQLPQNVCHRVAGGTHLDQVLLLVRLQIEPLPSWEQIMNTRRKCCIVKLLLFTNPKFLPQIIWIAVGEGNGWNSQCEGEGLDYFRGFSGKSRVNEQVWRGRGIAHGRQLPAY